MGKTAFGSKLTLPGGIWSGPSFTEILLSAQSMSSPLTTLFDPTTQSCFYRALRTAGQTDSLTHSLKRVILDPAARWGRGSVRLEQLTGQAAYVITEQRRDWLFKAALRACGYTTQGVPKKTVQLKIKKLLAISWYISTTFLFATY